MGQRFQINYGVGIYRMNRSTCWQLFLLCCAQAGFLLSTSLGAPLELEIDLAKTNGPIRALHGVNLGPMCYRGTVDLTSYHRELKIPLTRLHDVVWVNAEAVDLHTIFRDPRNDTENAASYDFRATDDYVHSVLNAGSKIVYRLGESIEHTARRYYVHPPADRDRWAAICLKIIEHYNRGWAEGFHDNIVYWEIWNEPDVRPAMWSGDDLEYFRLYEASAKAIKARFPEVKVGGPAVGGTGTFSGSEFRPSPFLVGFLAYCRQHNLPLDFFSWHQYTSDPWDLERRARAIRLLLDENGFTKTESHLNEWNYLPDNNWGPMLRSGQGAARRAWYEKMGGPEGAAFAACALILFQDVPLDAANFYTGEIQGFGLFNIFGEPKSSFYAFAAFRQLLDEGTRVAVTGAPSEHVAFLAAMNSAHSSTTLLAANLGGLDIDCRTLLRNYPWEGVINYQVLAIDRKPSLAELDHGFLKPGAPLLFGLPKNSVALVKLRPAGRDAEGANQH